MASPATGELQARPRQGAGRASAPTGLLPQNESSGKTALLSVPELHRDGQALPLLVMLHGAGGTAHHSMDIVRSHADDHGVIILAPGSKAQSWDVISGRSYGPDVASIDGLLSNVFDRYAIDPERIAIGGFSDGASYALSLGLMNGELFHHILAFSPGFMAPVRTQGLPKVFMSHGVQDGVLPIDVCSRRIAAQLREAGYPLDYREFSGGHTVPAGIAEAAFRQLPGNADPGR